MLGFFIGFLTVVLVLVSLLMVLIVLMQRPKQEGLGAAFGGGVTDQMWGAQTTNVLQRGTVYLAVMFFLITMALALLVNSKQKGVRDFNRAMAGDTSGPSNVPSTPPALTSGQPLTAESGQIDEIKLTPGGDNQPITVAPTPPTDPAPVPPVDPAPTPPVDPAPAPVEGGVTAPGEASAEDAPVDPAAAVEKLLEEAVADPEGAAVEAPKDPADGAADAPE